MTTRRRARLRFCHLASYRPAYEVGPPRRSTAGLMLGDRLAWLSQLGGPLDDEPTVMWIFGFVS